MGADLFLICPRQNSSTFLCFIGCTEFILGLWEMNSPVFWSLPAHCWLMHWNYIIQNGRRVRCLLHFLLLWDWWNIGTYWPEKLWTPCPYKCSMSVQCQNQNWSFWRCACSQQRELDYMTSKRSLLIQTILWFYEFTAKTTNDQSV